MRLLLFCSLCILISGCRNGSDGNNKQTHTDSIHTVLNETANYVTTTANRTNTISIFYYDTVYTISGILCYKDICPFCDADGNGNHDSVTVVVLKTGISLRFPPGRDSTGYDYNPTEDGVDTLELIANPDSAYGTLAKHIGDMVQLKGVFFHSSNGIQYTDVLMRVSELKDGNFVARFKQENEYK